METTTDAALAAWKEIQSAISIERKTELNESVWRDVFAEVANTDIQQLRHEWLRHLAGKPANFNVRFIDTTFKQFVQDMTDREIVLAASFRRYGLQMVAEPYFTKNNSETIGAKLERASKALSEAMEPVLDTLKTGVNDAMANLKVAQIQNVAGGGDQNMYTYLAGGSLIVEMEKLATENDVRQFMVMLSGLGFTIKSASGAVVKSLLEFRPSTRNPEHMCAVFKCHDDIISFCRINQMSKYYTVVPA